MTGATDEAGRSISAVRRAETLGAHVSAVDSRLNGFVTVLDRVVIERELELALSDEAAVAADPLRGRPLAVKDNIHIAGLPSTAGTRSLASFVPGADAPAVARLKARGMVVIGTTNMHELALGVTSSHTATGPVVNAVDPSRVAGGSSGGSGAVVGAGVVELALGSDTGGSSRIPAVFNDCWGFRPSTGRYDEGGVTGLAFTRDTIGPMAASLEGLELLDSALARDPGASRLPGSIPASELRIGYDPSDADRCSETVRTAFEEAVTRLVAAGISLVPVDLGPIDDAVGAFEPGLGAQELAATLEWSLESQPGAPSFDELRAQLTDPHVAHLIDGSVEATASGVWNGALHALLNDAARVRSAYLRMLANAGVAAIIRPAIPDVPERLERVIAMTMEERNALFGQTTRFARLATVVGSPSLAIPLGRLSGRSMTGLLVELAPGDDPEAFRVAGALREALTAAA